MSNVIDWQSRRSGKDRPLNIATGPTVRTNKVKNQTFKWAQLVEKLSVPTVTQETIADYLKMPRETQDKIKDVGYFVPAHYTGGVRKGRNLGLKDLGTLDFDHAKPEFLDSIKAIYNQLAFVLYTTHKHTPEKPRFRLVFLFSRAVTDAEYPAIMRQLAARGDINECDDTTFQPSRVMHFASHAVDGEFVFYANDGGSLDVDAVLKSYLDWHDIAEWPVSDRVKNPLRVSGAKAQDPREKTGFVGAFCNSYDIYSALDTFLPGVYAPGSSPDRFTFVGGSTSNGAIVYDDGLFLFSYHESDPCGGINVNAFDLVRLHKFADLDQAQSADLAPTKFNSYKAMVDLAKADKAVQAWLINERLQVINDFDDFEVPEALRPENPGPPAVEADPGLKVGQAIQAWRLQVTDDFRVAKDRMWNIEQIMQNDVNLKGCVAMNRFSGELVQRRPIPGLHRPITKEGAPWSDLAEFALQRYFNKNFDVAFNSKLINQACILVGGKNEFDPVRDWMDTLTWDGTPRLATFLPRYVGTEETPYTAAIFTKWLCAGVARTYHPGHKFDFILVLEGVEGVGKSRLLEALANGWFCGDFTFGLDSKKVIEQTAGALIVEIAEMVSRNNTEVEHTKAMLSRSTERARMSYAHNAVNAPRRWIAAGTTNDTTYLKSETGNRRFWMARSDGRPIDVEAVRAVVPQLWAEARDRWQIDGEPLWLDDALVAEYAVGQQAARVETDERSGLIAAWLELKIPSNHWEKTRHNETNDEGRAKELTGKVTMVERDRVCAAEIWFECLNGGAVCPRTETIRINNILRKIPGWYHRHVRMGIRYGTQRAWANTPSDDEDA
jgi:putative DNA primase/helicase